MEWFSSSAGIRASSRAVAFAMLGVWSFAVPLAVVQGETPGEGAGAEVPSSFPQHLTVCGDRVLFSADDGVYGRELWGVDAAGLARLALNIQGGPAGGNPRNLINGGLGRLLFVAETSDLGEELWIWSESSRQGRVLRDFVEGAGASNVTALAIQQDKFLVLAKGGSGSPRQVFSVTDRGGVTLLPIPVGSLDNIPGGCALGDTSFVLGSRIGLWLSDGTPEGTIRLVKSESYRDFELMTPVGEKVVFRAKDAIHGRELWSSDGTPEGTQFLMDIFPGPPDSSISQVTGLGDVACFQADDGTHGLELWVSDGTAEGTRFVADIAPGSQSSDPHYFERVGSVIYFCANDGRLGTELYRTDLTTEGTRLVADLMPGPVGSQPWSLKEFRGRLYFCANSQQYGEEVFVTDGTPQGTQVLKDIVPGKGYSGPDNLANLHDTTLFFTCNDGIHGEELWLSDGTSAGTRLAADLWMHEKQQPVSSRPTELTALGNQVIYAATDPDHGTELWVSDGSEVGTHVLADLNPGTEGSDPRELAALHGRVYFRADVAGSGGELWCTDGTGRGTAQVSDLRPGAQGSQPQMLTAAGESLYFAADDGTGGRELWRLGPEAAAPVLAAELTPGPEGTAFEEVFELWGQLFMYVNTTGGSLALWWYDPAVASARCILGSVPKSAPDTLGAMGDSDQSSSAMETTTSSDPAPSSAVLIAAVHPPRCEANGARPAMLGGTTFFVNHTRGHGAELWATDGTWTGTHLVADLYPGPASSSPSALIAAGDRVFFSAEIPQTGRVLCKSDGTPEGTSAVLCVRQSTATTEPVYRVREACYLPPSCLILVAATPFSPFEDIELLRLDWGSGGYALRLAASLIEGDQSANPRELTAAESVVCLVADDPIYGSELWRLEPGAMASSIISEGGIR
ncbi:MAG: hypothetical protein IT364_14130 [Candidatus Hydrogenedentes bacterium]|nr:hypothetical protein [Candidatus Hydrogenedentota bacterium]